jgi:hypothetical protein
VRVDDHSEDCISLCSNTLSTSLARSGMLGDFHEVFEFLLDKAQPLDAIEKMWDERP